MKGGFAAQIVDGKMVEDSNNAESIPNVPNNKFYHNLYLRITSDSKRVNHNTVKRFLTLGHIYFRHIHFRHQICGSVASVYACVQVMSLKNSQTSHRQVVVGHLDLYPPSLELIHKKL
jgi:hypothetical protein